MLFHKTVGNACVHNHRQHRLHLIHNNLGDPFISQLESNSRGLLVAVCSEERIVRRIGLANLWHSLMWAQKTQAQAFWHAVEPPPYRYVCSFTVGEGAVGRDQGATHTHVLSAKSMRSVCRRRNSFVPAVGGGGGVRLLSSKTPVPPVAHAGKTSIERM